MDSLSEIISTFTIDNIKEFRIFLNRQKRIKNRKDLKLFNLLLNNPKIKPKEVIKTLEYKNNSNAYHALRKKLTKQLMDFILLKRIDDDSSTISNIMGMISLSRYLFEHNRKRLAWKYLDKAEMLASINEEYDQLHTIYNIQIELSDSDHSPDLQIILENYKKNKILVEQNEQASIAYSIIKQRLKEVRLSGKVINFDKLIKNVIDNHNLSSTFQSSPKIFHQIMTIFRSAIVVKKDYYSFEPFIINHYQRFISEIGFEEKNMQYKSSILYMIAHTLYRNKKFNESNRYLNLLKESFDNMIKSNYILYYQRYIMLMAANQFFTNNIEKAIKILETSLKSNNIKHDSNARLNIILNLSFYYIYNDDSASANKILSTIFHSNKWCEKIMGKEWILKKNLAEIIIQYEIGNHEIALNRIRSLERTTDKFMLSGQYERVKVFINLIKDIINDPIDSTSTEFIEKVDNSFDWLPMEQEDLQAVMYYAWFKSKLVQKPSYEILLQLSGEI